MIVNLSRGAVLALDLHQRRAPARAHSLTMLPVQYSAAPPVPARVRLELTAPRPDGGEMSYAFFLRLLRELRALGVKEIGLAYFGEAAGCRWLPEAIRHAKETLGFESVFLTSSARMATPERVRACIEAGLDSLELADKDEAALKAARAARDDIKARTGRNCAVVAASWKPVRRLKLPCPAVFNEAVVTCDARLSVCPYHRDTRFAVGDLTCETFLECWHDERFQRLREAHLARDVDGTPCEGCSAYG